MKDRDVRSILLAEDDENLRQVLRQVLESFGYTVFEACDGGVVNDVYELHPDIDLAMLDVSMPGTNGITAAQQLQRSNPRLPVLLMTGFSREMVMCNGDLRGAFRIISKPFQFDQLRGVIGDLLTMPTEGNCGDCPVNQEVGCSATVAADYKPESGVSLHALTGTSN